MFPNLRKLQNPFRAINIPDRTKRNRHLLGLDEEMVRDDLGVLTIGGVGDLLQGLGAVPEIRIAVHGCVTGGRGGVYERGVRTKGRKSEQDAELDRGGEMHDIRFRNV